MTALTMAVPKGRILAALANLLERAGVDAAPLRADDRRLVRQAEGGELAFVFLKPDDVPTYVEYGAADLGIAGRDTLLERRHDVYIPVDLRIGCCRLVVAGPDRRLYEPDRRLYGPDRRLYGPDRRLYGPYGACIPDVPRVATKYPHIAAEHFAKKGIQAEVIPVHGSVELAPLVGLAHLIVDIVETGATLRENNLEILETVADVSTVVVANRAAYKLRASAILPLLQKLRQAADRPASEPPPLDNA